MMFYTYVLLSESDKNFYVGFTNDLKRRLDEHHKGSVDSSVHRRPLRLVYYEACLNENDAVKREKYFKTGFGRRFLRNRLETYLKEACSPTLAMAGRALDSSKVFIKRR